MNYTKEQLIEALQKEYEYLCLNHPEEHPDYEEVSLEEHLKYLGTLSLQELKDSTEDEDDSYTLDEYMNKWLLSQ